MKNLQPLSGITKPWLLRALTLLLLLAMLCPFQAQVTSAAPLGSGIPPGRSDRVLHLKFVEGTDTTDLQPLLPAEAWQIIQKIRPLYSLSKSLLKEFKVKGSERLKKEKGDAAPDLPGLDLWYEITLVQDADGEVAITLLAALPNVEYAGGAPLDSELPTTPDFSSQQGYLDPATYGIDAEYAWTIAGDGGGSYHL